MSLRAALDRRSGRWPLYVVFGAFPLWWALGIGAFIFPIAAIPMALSLLARRPLRLPKGIGLWLGFIGWMLASAMMLHLAPEAHSGRALAFVYRGSLYLSATVFLLYFYQRSSRQVPVKLVLGVMTWLLACVMLLGVAGIVLHHGEFRTVAERLLPHSLATNAFVHSLVHAQLASGTSLLGFRVARPIAPFNYTNEWGANVALLIPFAVALVYMARRKKVRILLVMGLIASVVPIIISLNKGLWLSLSLGVVLIALRLAARGRAKAFITILLTMGVVAAVVLLTPLGHVILDRLAHSNTATRSSLYAQAQQSAAGSPVFGYGSPISTSSQGPSVGTHGQLWTLLVSNGIPAAALYIGFFGYCLLRFRRLQGEYLWLHAVIFIGLVQLPYYNALPVELHIMMVSLALLARAHAEEPVPSPARARLPVALLPTQLQPVPGETGSLPVSLQ
jgi:hypothetical protein